MNERIKELLHKSLDNCYGSPTETIYSLKQSEIDKFAELIVRECAEKLIYRAGQYSKVKGQSLRVLCYRTASNIVLSHFNIVLPHFDYGVKK
jgi:hypothetical protein